MKHTIYIISALMAGLLAVSCSVRQDDILQGETIRFQASGGTFTTKADAAPGFAKGVTFSLSADDPVSVRNVTLVSAGDGSLVPETPVYWGVDQKSSDKATFYAISPAEYDPKDVFLFAVDPNQSLEEGAGKSDLVWAMDKAAPEDGVVALHFTHALSRLAVTVESDFADDPVESAILSGINLWAEVDLAERSVTVQESVGRIVGNQVSSENGEIFTFILPPQVAKPTLFISLKSGMTVVCPALEAISFASGKQAVATVSLVDSEAGFTAQVFPWLDNKYEAFGPDLGKAKGIVWSVYGNLNNWTPVPLEEVEKGVFRGTATTPDYSTDMSFCLVQSRLGVDYDQYRYYSLFDETYRFDEGVDELVIPMSPDGIGDAKVDFTGTAEIDWIPARQVILVRKAR